MKRTKTFARVERERERATTLVKNKAKKLALLSVYKADYKYENT